MESIRLGAFCPDGPARGGALNFGLSQNIEAKVADKETGELRRSKSSTTLPRQAITICGRFSQAVDLQTRAFTSLFNRVNVNLNATHSAYARKSGNGPSHRHVSRL